MQFDILCRQKRPQTQYNKVSKKEKEKEKQKCTRQMTEDFKVSSLTLKARTKVFANLIEILKKKINKFNKNLGKEKKSIKLNINSPK